MQEAGAQQQVLGWIAAQGQLREQHHVGAELVARLLDHRGNPLGVLRHGADREVELGHRDT
jgi:hypothetical protein